MVIWVYLAYADIIVDLFEHIKKIGLLKKCLNIGFWRFFLYFVIDSNILLCLSLAIILDELLNHIHYISVILLGLIIILCMKTIIGLLLDGNYITVVPEFFLQLLNYFYVQWVLILILGFRKCLCFHLLCFVSISIKTMIKYEYWINLNILININF